MCAEVELSAMRNFGAYVRVAKAVLAVGREEHLSVTAAGLAYYMFVSVITLGLLGFVGLATVGENALVGLLVRAAATDTASWFFERSVEESAGRIRAAVIAVVFVLWSSLRMFHALQAVFADLYDVRKEATTLDRAFTVGLGFGVVSLALALLSVLGVGLSLAVKSTVWTYVGPLLLFPALLVVFFPLYYVFPREVSVREALPGTVLAAASWTVSAAFFRWYATLSESVRLYGIAGGVLLLLAWLYVAALVLLVGVVLNAVLAGRVTPDYDWLPNSDGE